MNHGRARRSKHHAQLCSRHRHTTYLERFSLLLVACKAKFHIRILLNGPQDAQPGKFRFGYAESPGKRTHSRERLSTGPHAQELERIPMLLPRVSFVYDTWNVLSPREAPFRSIDLGEVALRLRVGNTPWFRRVRWALCCCCFTPPHGEEASGSGHT